MNNKLEQIFDKTYRAAIFDFDGTLTAPYFGSTPPESLCTLLQEMCQKIPMAICSGRNFPGLIAKLEALLGERFLELRQHWPLFAENGSVGFRFNADSFEEFYRAEWPEQELPRKELDEKIQHSFSKIVDYISINPSSYIFRPRGWEHLPTERLAVLTDELEIFARDFLREHHIDHLLEIGNSKLGIIMYLKSVDKDRAIQEFGELLELKSPYREIIVVGDQPGPGGNDQAFLNGTFGTSFTVGTRVEKSEWPIAVELTGPAGTESLLRRLKFQK